MEAFVDWLFELFALPKVGLPAVFLIALISATLLPLGSEPAVFAYVKLAPDMFWPCILVATAGNVIGGMIDWWMGYEARKAWIHYRRRHRLAGGTDAELVQRRPKLGERWFAWMRRHGPPVLLLAWLPGVGDPLCAVAGWLRLKWRPCLFWMTVGKLIRYIVMTSALLWIPDSFWRDVMALFRS
ncbi:MAG: YqaA family protein [Betaproteobacteria bacterium]